MSVMQQQGSGCGVYVCSLILLVAKAVAIDGHGCTVAGGKGCRVGVNEEQSSVCQCLGMQCQASHKEKALYTFYARAWSMLQYVLFST